MTNTAPKAPTDSDPEFRFDEQAYQLARAAHGFKYEKDVAEALQIHEATWVRIRSGQYPLTDRIRAAIHTVMPKEYGKIVRSNW